MGVMRSVKSVILGTYVLLCCEVLRVLRVLGVLRELFGVLMCFLSVASYERYEC